MTHEHLLKNEADDGPENDNSLPDAVDIPVADGPDELGAMIYGELEDS